MRSKDVRKLGRSHGSAAARIASRKCVGCACADMRSLASDIFEEDLLSLDWTHRGRSVQEILEGRPQQFREYEKSARKALAATVAARCGGR